MAVVAKTRLDAFIVGDDGDDCNEGEDDGGGRRARGNEDRVESAACDERLEQRRRVVICRAGESVVC